VALEVVPLGEDAETRLQVRAQRMPDVDLEDRRKVLQLLGGDLAAIAVGDVAEREGDGEEVRAKVEAGTRERRVGVVGGQERAGEEHGELLAFAPEVEVEVLDSEQRERVIERIVVERAEQANR